jgi:hypothetical protein
MIYNARRDAGSLVEARRLLERAVSLGDVPLPPTTPDMHVSVLNYLALALVHQGCADQGRARIEEAASRAAALERPFDRGMVANTACFNDRSIQTCKERTDHRCRRGWREGTLRR